MRKKNEKEMTPGIIDGTKGTVDVFDMIQGALTAGVRIVRTNSDVPKRPHVHSEKQLIYVISGTGKITNGLETISVKPGDFVLLEENEEHYVITDKDELKLFEIKYA
jgi:quercetin dioxygenase-like cupin family protein